MTRARGARARVMSESTVGEFICPVCDQALHVSAPKCFRCTTELTNWWPLEEALRTGPAAVDTPTRVQPPATQRSYSHYGAVLVLGVLLGLAGANRWFAPRPDEHVPQEVFRDEAPRPSPRGEATSAPETTTPPTDRPLVLYTVQPGDSLWRIAAALTGDGRNWQDLWPSYEGRETRLPLGAQLEIPLAAVKKKERRLIEEEQ
jgi:hypothetical protein